MAKIIHVYLFHNKLFSLFSISVRIFEQELLFSLVNDVYSEIYQEKHYIEF